MKKLTFVRVSGIVTILAALTSMVNFFLTDPPVYMYGIALIGVLIGYIGIYQFQKDKAMALSLISIAVLLVTFYLYGSGRDDLGDIVYPWSFLVLGIAAYQAAKFPRWASIAMILGIVLSLLETNVSAIPGVVDSIGGWVVRLALLVFGYYLWNDAA